VTNPPTLSQWLARLRREFGVQCRLDGSGRVRVKGLRRLPAAEKAALFAASAEVQALLGARVRRRSRRKDEEQHRMASPPERPRRVIGQHVVPGYPQLARPLYADEVKLIDVHRARVLGTVPYGWRK
jgi:hypothetical protein